MKIYKKVSHIVSKEVCVDIYCDICNKKIDTKDKFYEITTSHFDWGNDSIDSINNHDVCSNKCLFLFLADYYDDFEDRHTKRIEIQHENGWYRVQEEKVSE